jgi:hypothetical protein
MRIGYARYAETPSFPGGANFDTISLRFEFEIKSGSEG